MATLIEQYNIVFSDNSLKNRVTMACIVAAKNVFGEDAGTTNHANRLVWAKACFSEPQRIGSEMFRSAVQLMSDPSNIDSVTDTAIQNGVNGLVDQMANAEAGA